VEDSGGWNVFKRADRNAGQKILCQTKFPQTIISGLYSKPSYLSNHHIKVWALYIQNHGLSSIFVKEFE